MTQTLEGPTRTRGKDASPAIAWIKHVLRSRPEAQVTDFAVAAGVSRKTVANLIGPNPRPSLYAGTYEQIMSTRPEDVRIARRRIVDGTPAKEIIASLTQEGWTITEIAKAGGIKPSTLTPGNLDRIYAETFARLVRAQRMLNRRSLNGDGDPRALAPSYRVLRRAEALMAMGWRREEIARRAQVSVHALRTTKRSVLRSTSDRVHVTFKSMRLTLGDSPITQERARRLGYAPWAAWPGRSIDDEGAVPDWDFVEDLEWREAIRRRYEP